MGGQPPPSRLLIRSPTPRISLTRSWASPFRFLMAAISSDTTLRRWRNFIDFSQDGFAAVIRSHEKVPIERGAPIDERLPNDFQILSYKLDFKHLNTYIPGS